MLTEPIEFVCGYCGEISTIVIDTTGGEDQSYVEDCSVCCRPNRVLVQIDPETGEIVDVRVVYEG